jgi:hypothetical protein
LFPWACGEIGPVSQPTIHWIISEAIPNSFRNAPCAARVSIEALSGRLLFKGGTSLSKIFHAINRFSEDIDLAVDYEALGFKEERDPRREGISKTRRAAILDEMMLECRRYIGGDFLDVLKARCREILGATNAWTLAVSEQDPNVVQFHYPTAITKNLDYVSPQVVLSNEALESGDSR